MNTQPDSKTDARRWAAVLARDRGAEDAFVYAVRTTGVYCRPGCASRRPRRDNVAFFATAGAAEREGYRACRRCRPGGDSPARRGAALVARACRALDATDAAPRLNDLAKQAGLSRWHFHRLFKDAVGVTPRQYAVARRVARLENGLAPGRSVTAAIHAAGFGSASGAYAVSRERLGMRPAEHRAGAPHRTIRHAFTKCSLGTLLVAATDRGLCAIEFGAGRRPLLAGLRTRFPAARHEPAGRDFAATLAKIVKVVEMPSRGLDLPLDVQGTAFQQRVWQALRGIAPGETASYAEVARRIGRPRATRAVAAACAANRLAVAIPCHRVTCSDGAPGGYRWGARRKGALLRREKEAKQ